MASFPVSTPGRAGPSEGDGVEVVDPKRTWYPTNMKANLRQLQPETLRRYCKVYGLHLPPDCTPYDMAICTGRHFEATLDVDEEEALMDFCSVLRRKDPGDVVSKTAVKAKGGYRGRPAKKSKRINAAKATAPRASAPAEEGSEGADVPFSGRGEPAASAEEDIPVQAEQGFPEEPEQEDDDGEETHCYCKKGDFGEMIACDNTSCPIEWFHLSCVGLSPSTRPGDEDKWYCPECRGAWGSSTRRFTGAPQPRPAPAGRYGRGGGLRGGAAVKAKRLRGY